MSTTIPDLAQKPDFFSVSDALEKAKQITAEIYGGLQQCEEAQDFDFAGDRFFSLSVQDSGTPDEISCRYDEWHRRISAFPPYMSGLFRLTVDVQ